MMILPNLNLKQIDEYRSFNIDTLEKDYQLTVGGNLSRYFQYEKFDTIDIVNGVPNEAKLPEGVEIEKCQLSLYEGVNPFIDVNKDYNNTSYNIVFTSNTGKPVIINNYYTENQSFIPSNVKITLNNRVKVDILEISNTSEEILVINNRDFDITNSVLNYSRYDLTGDKTTLIYNYYGEINKGNLNAVTLNNRGYISLNNWDMKLVDPNSECSINGVIKLNERMKHGTVCKIKHLADNTISTQEFRHILDGKSYAMYDGDSYIEGRTEECSSSQVSKSVMLSESARILNKPRLNIFTGEVKATHGASVGKLDMENIFYLKQRGLPEELINEILIEAFTKDILDRIPSELIRERIYEER